ncbi:RPA-interacting protein isoform X3 [Gallus gallus]|uniref:RPA-interacting protein isoform X3 n=1 Tax=Gallus gallus TaxID=9031 RepID=UPI000739A89F|nr:RPA-interacting protein isoform X3 [Gallus gallus]XP_040543038.1 RPA-interacting protein isoform X3 [Gallus gallus]|eukprot:XP_004946522.2 RPA-interacting protein isoform X1 [Gallus gallus]
MEGPLGRHRALYKGPAAPPWKETYRRRCLERLKSSRERLLHRYRQAGPGPGALLVPEVMEREWRCLQAERGAPGERGQRELQQRQLGRVSTRPQPQRCAFQMPQDPDELAVLDEIQQELILQEQLVIEEYERSLQFDEECLNAILDGLDASNRIICPVCRKNHLTVRSHSVVCQCGLDVPAQDMTEEKLRSLLENTITEHSHRCLHNPEFTVTSGMEEEASLLMTCLCSSTCMVGRGRSRAFQSET